MSSTAERVLVLGLEVERVAERRGVMSYAVTQRAHEIGIRMALGAARRNVLGMVMGRGLLLVGLGVVIGMAGALALTRLIASRPVGVQPTDPSTFCARRAHARRRAALATLVPAMRLPVSRYPSPASRLPLPGLTSGSVIRRKLWG